MFGEDDVLVKEHVAGTALDPEQPLVRARPDDSAAAGSTTSTSSEDGSLVKEAPKDP